MAGFSAEWLALRESADHAARSPELTRTVIDFLPDRARILDLAAGTGSNRRYLAAAGSERADATGIPERVSGRRPQQDLRRVSQKRGAGE